VGGGGGIGAEPSFSEWVHQRVPADEMPVLIKQIVETFAAHRDEGQPFREWIGEFGVEALTDAVDPAESDYEDACLTDGKQAWYPFDSGDSPAPTKPDGTPISADD
jgi:ferredoxin-nitrite reductase